MSGTGDHTGEGAITKARARRDAPPGRRTIGRLVRAGGLEPPMAGPEPAVLPITPRPIGGAVDRNQPARASTNRPERTHARQLVVEIHQAADADHPPSSEEHPSEPQSLMRNVDAVFF